MSRCNVRIYQTTRVTRQLSTPLEFQSSEPCMVRSSMRYENDANKSDEMLGDGIAIAVCSVLTKLHYNLLSKVIDYFNNEIKETWCRYSLIVILSFLIWYRAGELIMAAAVADSSLYDVPCHQVFQFLDTLLVSLHCKSQNLSC